MIAQGGEIGIVFHPLTLSPTGRGGFFQTIKRLLGLTQQSVNASDLVQDLEFVGFHLHGVFQGSPSDEAILRSDSGITMAFLRDFKIGAFQIRIYCSYLVWVGV